MHTALVYKGSVFPCSRRLSLDGPYALKDDAVQEGSRLIGHFALKDNAAQEASCLVGLIALRDNAVPVNCRLLIFLTMSQVRGALPPIERRQDDTECGKEVSSTCCELLVRSTCCGLPGWH